MSLGKGHLKRETERRIDMFEGLILLAVFCSVSVQFLNNISYMRFCEKTRRRLSALEDELFGIIDDED